MHTCSVLPKPMSSPAHKRSEGADEEWVRLRIAMRCFNDMTGVVIIEQMLRASHGQGLLP